MTEQHKTLKIDSEADQPCPETRINGKNVVIKIDN